MSWSRHSKAWLACVLVLLHALLPALHGWSHALEAAAEHGHVCADCGRCTDDAEPRGDGRLPVLDHRHEATDECGLCVVLQTGRSLLLPTGSLFRAPASPPRPQLGEVRGACFVAPPALRPPARAPPAFLS